MERSAKVRRLCETAYRAEVALDKHADEKLSQRMLLDRTDDEFYGSCVRLGFSLARYGEPVLPAGRITICSPTEKTTSEGATIRSDRYYVVRRSPSDKIDLQNYIESGNWALEVPKDPHALVVMRYDPEIRHVMASDEAMTFVAQASTVLEELIARSSDT
jgi:hypothetical protein